MFSNKPFDFCITFTLFYQFTDFSLLLILCLCFTSVFFDLFLSLGHQCFIYLLSYSLTEISNIMNFLLITFFAIDHLFRCNVYTISSSLFKSSNFLTFPSLKESFKSMCIKTFFQVAETLLLSSISSIVVIEHSLLFAFKFFTLFYFIIFN